MKNIVFLAPPAAGKGTHSDLLRDKYGYIHISMGELLRNARSTETEIGRKIIEAQDSGGLVENDITFGLLKERLREPDCNNGFIMDGFPRSIEQALEYEKILKELNKDLGIVIYIDIDQDLAMKRTLGRLTCDDCSTIYNKFFDNLEDGAKCGKCGGKLSARSDDNEETFKVRFNTFFEKTQPLIDYYENKGILRKVKANMDKNVTFSDIDKIVNE